MIYPIFLANQKAVNRLWNPVTFFFLILTFVLFFRGLNAGLECYVVFDQGLMVQWLAPTDFGSKFLYYNESRKPRKRVTHSQTDLKISTIVAIYVYYTIGISYWTPTLA